MLILVILAASVFEISCS